ncbi:MAG: sigma-70 family RNA polymerase sigma factor, partial [Planctomycetota bacterium]
ISDGMVGLVKAIDAFEPERGFKFSTYACRAILKGFSRLGMKTTRHRSLFPVGFEPDLERSNYTAEKAADDEQGCVEQVARIFRENRSGLNELERDIIEKRFAFDNPDGGKGMTLKEVGKLVGLTKERVRQIQIHALAKMRDTLEDTYLNGPSLGEALGDAGVTPTAQAVPA